MLKEVGVRSWSLEFGVRSLELIKFVCRMGCKKICKIFASEFGSKSGVMRGFQKGITLGGRTSGSA